MITHPVLSQLAQHGVKLGLDRVKAFLAAIGEPHRAVPCVHVGGTNGKGSVSTFVASALRASGYRVGTTLSPHLEHVNERVQIDGVPLDDGALNEAIEGLDRLRRDWIASQGLDASALTYFEFVAVLAFQVFAQARVDASVIEVGMGGRLDATNVVQPLVAAITSIGLDHQAELGPTVEHIAIEKAGILKRGTPLVLGVIPPAGLAEIERRAAALGCPVWKPGPQLRKQRHNDDSWSLDTPSGSLPRVTLGLRGDHQGSNALVALGVVHRLRELGFHLPDDAVRRGFETAFIPGRLESPVDGLLLDGAHNEDGARALAAYLARQPRPATRILLFGMGAGRDPRQVVAPLVAHVDEIVTTRCAHPKALDPMDLAAALHGLPVALSAGGDIDDTLPEVFAEADETVVAGSLYLVGAARSLVTAGALDGLEPGMGPLDDGEWVDVDEHGEPIDSE